MLSSQEDFFFLLDISFSTTSFRCYESEGEKSLSRHVSWFGQERPSSAEALSAHLPPMLEPFPLILPGHFQIPLMMSLFHLKQKSSCFSSCFKPLDAILECDNWMTMFAEAIIWKSESFWGELQKQCSDCSEKQISDRRRALSCGKRGATSLRLQPFGCFGASRG